MKKKELFIVLIAFLCSLSMQQIDAANQWDKRVYLATYPRSGNHWMRHLIEEATHIATSSVYRDHDRDGNQHLNVVFPWGGYCVEHGYAGDCRYPREDEAVVIKTHYPTVVTSQFDKQPYFKVIRVIRHPVDSIYSYYLYRNHDRPPTVTIPRDQLREFIASWRQFQNYWDKQDKVITIRYEDLYREPEYNLRRVLKAVGYEVTDEDIRRAIAKNPPQGGFLKHRRHFPIQDLKLIKNELKGLMDEYGYRITAIEFQGRKDVEKKLPITPWHGEN